MSFRFPIQVQIFLGLVTGVLLGLLFQNISAINPEGLIEVLNPMPPQTQYVYENLEIAWKVRVVVFPDKPPIISSVERIEETRISDLQSGKNEISLIDDVGRKIYSQTFKVSYLITGIESKLSQRELIFILPFIENSRKIVITTPEGVTEYELPK